MGESYWSDGYEDGLLFAGIFARTRSENTQRDIIRAILDNLDCTVIVPPTEIEGEWRACVYRYEPHDVICSHDTAKAWQEGYGDLLALRVVPHDKARFEGYDNERIALVGLKGVDSDPFKPVPYFKIGMDELAETDAFSGYGETPSIVYQGHVLQGTFWMSGNDGVWKDSWHDLDLQTSSEDAYFFWDDLGVLKLGPLLEAGLSKAMHYVNLKTERQSVKESRRLS